MSATSVDDRIFAPRPLVGWALFTLTAGFVNGAAVMSCNSFVTHVTGNITSIALDASVARAFFLVVVAFIIGAMLAVLMAETSKARSHIGFLVPVLASFVVLIAISVAGKAGAFGAFGASSKNGSAFVMLAFLAAAMGMINASIAVATANKIRITHLTGPATDLAGNIVRAALDAGEGSRVELRWAALRLAKLIAFAVGAACAARVAARLEYDLFAAAALLMILALGFAGAPHAVANAGQAESDERTDDEKLGDEAFDETVEPGGRPAANADTSGAFSRDVNVARCEDAMPPLPPLFSAPERGSKHDESKDSDRHAAE